jgi:hypothetical protein
MTKTIYSKTKTTYSKTSYSRIKQNIIRLGLAKKGIHFNDIHVQQAKEIYSKLVGNDEHLIKATNFVDFVEQLTFSTIRKRAGSCI